MLAVPSRNERWEVVRKDVRSVVVGIPLAADTLVAGAEVTRGVVLGKSLLWRLVNVT